MTCLGQLLHQAVGKTFMHVAYFQGHVTAIIKTQ